MMTHDYFQQLIGHLTVSATESQLDKCQNIFLMSFALVDHEELNQAAGVAYLKSLPGKRGPRMHASPLQFVAAALVLGQAPHLFRHVRESGMHAYS